jgi:hypothetical protein
LGPASRDPLAFFLITRPPDIAASSFLTQSSCNSLSIMVRLLIRRRLDMEHYGLRLRSDGTIDTDYYVSRARARRQGNERLIDEATLPMKRRIVLDALAHMFRRSRTS